MRKSIAIPSPHALLPKALLAGLAIAAGLAMSHPAKAMVSISVRIAPPPLMVYEQPMIPAAGYIWVPGYWAWDDEIGDYYWVPGQWVLPPFAGALWTPGYWAWNDGVYFFHRGYWGPVVGYYGGINYGFGYFGVDYVGGYWRGGVFNYNRGYNHIDNRVVNVYNNTTIINKTVINNNRVSYNGGPGGTNIQPTNQQRQIDRQRHWDAVPDQRAAMQRSREDRTARFGYNHGQADRMQWRGVQSATPPAAPAQQQPVATVQPPRPQQQAQRHPQQWPGARERMPTPEDRAAMREERRTSARPPMPTPSMQPRMQHPQPPVMRAPQPIAHPGPQQQQAAHGSGNPHRDDRRRDHRDNGGD
ncbi:MAG: YXWGXW repeat-containing protein [Proteobacteria bacterium]|nr:YXWGXW repeat-containing protein [Pseudomonadota bacterium]